VYKISLDIIWKFKRSWKKRNRSWERSREDKKLWWVHGSVCKME